MKVVISDINAERLPLTEDCKGFFPDKSSRRCIGCFQCWTRTPGQCVLHDGLEDVGTHLGNADSLVLISRCCYGSVSPEVKRALDRSISYVHPGFEVRAGELHHRRRYANKLAIRAHIYGAATEAERETMRGILKANALNFAATLQEVAFYPSADSLLQEICL